MTRGAHTRRSSLVTRDGALVFTGRAVRTFSLGALSLALPLLLKHRGLSAAALGGVLTATLVEDALLTAAVTAMAPRWGRRRLLILSAIPMVAGGIALARNGRDPGMVATREIFTRSLAAFRDGTRPPVDGPEARRVLEVIAACYQSAATGQRVLLDGSDAASLAGITL